MEYCFINSDANYCLPTDTDSNSDSSNSICLPASVMYAYSSGCIAPSSSSLYYQYYSNNRGVSFPFLPFSPEVHFSLSLVARCLHNLY